VKTTRIVLSALISLLGVVHIAFTPVFYPGWGLDSLWFAGTGLGLVILGLMNALLVGRREKWTILLGAGANFASLTLLSMLAVTLGASRRAVGVALALGLFATGVLDSSNKAEKTK